MLPGHTEERPYDHLDFDDVRELLGLIKDLGKRYLLLKRLSEAPESGYNTVTYMNKSSNFKVNPFMSYRLSDLKKRLKFETDVNKVRLIQEALRMHGVKI